VDLKKISWLVARFRAMPSAEIPHRFLELLRKKYLEFRPESKSKINPTEIGQHYSFEALWEYDLEYLRSSSESVMQSGPSIFGRLWEKNGSFPIRWHTNLIGEDFGGMKAFEVPYRATEEIGQDARLTWELNRLVWLIPLAGYYSLSHNSETGKYLRRTLDSFIQSDKVGNSLRWNSSIELAVQALSLMVIEKLLGNHAAKIMPNEYLRALENRLRWLSCLPSKHSSENNHRIAEVVASICIIERLNIGRAKGTNLQTELKQLIQSQFGADGFNREQSFDYHIFTLDLIATAEILCTDLAIDANEAAVLKLGASLAFEVYGYCGFWPSANDSDEARILGVLERKGSPPLKLFERAFGEPHPQNKRLDSIHLESAGYFFWKWKSGELEIVLMVDHGKMGLAPLYAHAHADLQAVWLWVDKTPILIEAGTYSYHSSPEQRKYLQGSLSHNSISINELSIVEPAGPFVWHEEDLPTSSTFSYKVEDDSLSIHMSCSLPLKHQSFGAATWSRNIVAASNCLTIRDKLTGNSNLSLAAHWIIAPDLSPLPSGLGDLRLRSEAVMIRISSDENISISKTRVSPRYSQISETLAVAIKPKSNPIQRVDTSFEFWRQK